MTVGKTGVGEMGVGEKGQIIGETGIGETGVNHYNFVMFRSVDHTFFNHHPLKIKVNTRSSIKSQLKLSNFSLIFR